MKIIQKRFLAFLGLCISVRLLFVYIARHISNKFLPLLGFLALLPAVGFLYIFIFGKSNKRGETFNQKIWWGNLRPIHSFFYFYFAYQAFSKNPNAYIVLLIDVVFGLFSFIAYHASVGSFKKLL